MRVSAVAQEERSFADPTFRITLFSTLGDTCHHLVVYPELW